MTQNISNFTPEKAEIESLKIELGYARTKITDLQTKIADRDQTINIYSQQIKLLEESRTNTLHQRYFPSSNSNSESSNVGATADVSLSLDCSCKIRAQISRNSAHLRDIDSKCLTALDNIEKKLDNLYSKPVSSAPPLNTPVTRPPCTPTVCSPRSSSACKTTLSSTTPSQPTIPPSPIRDTDLHSLDSRDLLSSPYNEFNFDFSDSFSAPADSSPKIGLN